MRPNIRRRKMSLSQSTRFVELLETRTLLANAISLEFGAQEVRPGASGLDPTHIAGLAPSANWNNLRDAGGTTTALVDSTGAAVVGAGATWSANGGGGSSGTWQVENAAANAPGDEEMANSAIYAHPISGAQAFIDVSVTNVPYAKYTVIIYSPSDNDNNPYIDMTANGQTLYGFSPNNSTDADNDLSTPYSFNPITGTDVDTTHANGRNQGNYAVFTGVTGSTLNVNVKGGANPPVFNGPYNTTLSGIQIVEEVAGAGQISGTVYNDVNSNGLVNHPEKAFSPGWTVYLDANNNNVLDPGETNTVTDASGKYSFTGLADGTYHVHQVQQTGYRKSVRNGNTGYDLDVVGGSVFVGKDFANTTKILLGGIVFNDANNNGIQDQGEFGIQGVTLNVVSNNVTVASRVTDGNGRWQVRGLEAGSGQLNIVAPAGYTVTAPAAGNYSGSMSSGQANQNLNFGLHQTGPAPAPASVFASNSILKGAAGDPILDDLV